MHPHNNNNNTNSLSRWSRLVRPCPASRFSHHHDLWNAHGNYSGPGWGAKDDSKAAIPELFFFEKKNNFVSQWSSSRDVALVLCTSTHRGSAGHHRYRYRFSSTYFALEFRSRLAPSTAKDFSDITGFVCYQCTCLSR